MADKCIWTEDSDGIWETTCPNELSWSFIDGDGVEENGVKYCPFCGKPVEAVYYQVREYYQSENRRRV